MKKLYLILALALPATSCSFGIGIPEEDASGVLKVRIEQMKHSVSATTKVSYSGSYGEHSEFETGDRFGLFVFDDRGQIQAATNLSIAPAMTTTEKRSGPSTSPAGLKATVPIIPFRKYSGLDTSILHIFHTMRPTTAAHPLMR